jgi:hypothetical protein
VASKGYHSKELERNLPAYLNRRDPKKITETRGKIGILDKDARLLGTVVLIDVKGPFKPEELARYTYHKSTLERLKRFSNGKPLYAWVLGNAKKFDRPIKVNVKDTGTIEEVDIEIGNVTKG